MITRTHKQVCYYSASLGILKLVVLLLLRLVEHHLVFPWKHVQAPILQYRLQDEVSVGAHQALVADPPLAGSKHGH